MEEQKEKTKPSGFTKGLDEVYRTRTAAEYAKCLIDVRDICMTTETRGCSYSTYLNKMRGRSFISALEEQRLAEVFARYGVTDWQGTI